MSISSGGEATAIVENGGYVRVEEGASAAFASNTISGFTLAHDSTTVHSGTTVVSAAINERGKMYVCGGLVEGAILSGGINGDYSAVMHVYDGGAANNITLQHVWSYLYVSSGGKVTGTLNIAASAVVSAYEDSIVDFDLTNRIAEDAALVNNLSLIRGTPNYTITVLAEQTEGVYILAGGAAGFATTVTISVEGGGSDSITVGETVTLDGRDYTLNLDSSLLTLTVSGESPTPVVGGTAGDLNADGRADIVMTIDQASHPADGSTGAWLILEDQTAAWGDLSTRNDGWTVFGSGKTAAGKNTDDVYIKSSDNVIGAWTTDDDGKVSGWETIGEFSAETQIVGLGDFNGNGQTDLLLRNNNGAVGCFFTDGQGWNYFQSLGDEWKLSAVGDLNGDGRDDVVLKHDAGFAGSWLTQEDGTMAWADLDTLPDGFEIVGTGDFNGDGTDDILLKSGGYYGAWLVQNGNAAGWMGLGNLGDVTVEQIADFNGDGVDDLRIRTAAGDIGAELVMGADTLDWHYYGAVGSEWKTGLAALS